MLKILTNGAFPLPNLQPLAKAKLIFEAGTGIINMALPNPTRTALTIALISTVCFSQLKNLIEPSFSLSLSGTYGKATAYHYLLNKSGDSGVVIVNGIERPLVRKDFSRLTTAIVKYAMDLTEASYGSPNDSTDFSGELAIAALDRSRIIRLNAALTIGTLADGPMTGLLRLLMQQAADTLRLPQVAISKPPQKGKNRNAANRQKAIHGE
jgi:hypothetical protein